MLRELCSGPGSGLRLSLQWNGVSPEKLFGSRTSHVLHMSLDFGLQLACFPEFVSAPRGPSVHV